MSSHPHNNNQLKKVTLDFGLHPRQLFALFSKATEILYGGAAGGGKSFLMRVAAIVWCAQIPGLQVYIFRRTFPELFKNHMEGPSGFPTLLADWVTAKFCTINYSNHTIRFWNGSVIFLCHCQHEKSVFGFKGAEIHVLMVDELTQFTATMYRFLRSRMRLGSLQLPEQFKGLFPRALNGTNPGDVGHNWVKAAFVDNGPSGEVVPMPPKEGGMFRQFVRAKLDDNPSVDREDYAGKLEGLGDPALVRAMLEGDWDIVAGGMFDDLWNRDKHTLKPFQIPSSWRIDRCFDWGSSAPFSVGWWAESDGTEATMPDGEKRHFPRGTLICIMEWYGWNGTPNEGLKYTNGQIARGIMERERNMQWKVQPGPADSMIYNVEPGKKSIADEMAGERYVWTDAQGKRHEQYGPRFVPADKTPGSRKNGWERMRVLLYNVTHYPLEKPGLYVFDDCTQFIRTIPTLPRDEKNRDDVNCFMAGTLVSTSEGDKPIEQVRVGDLVYTPVGLRRVTMAGLSGNAETVTAKFSNGQSLTGTANHKVYVKNTGLIPLSMLKCGWILKERNSLWSNELHTMALNIGAIPVEAITRLEWVLSAKAEQACIGKSGLTITGQYLPSIMSITRIMTRIITSSKILSLSAQASMPNFTIKSEPTSMRRVMLGHRPQKQSNFFAQMLERCLQIHPTENLRALVVAALLEQDSQTQNAVPRNARSEPGLKDSKKTAPFAASHSSTSDTLTRKSAPVVISVVGNCGVRPVYNLTVEQAHLYYANGVLVTNTHSEDHIGDSTRYRVLQTTRRLVGV